MKEINVKTETPIYRIAAGICLLSLVTLTVELLMTRVFDIILTPNMSYMVVTCVMFSFGLAGVYYSIKPLSDSKNVRKYLAVLSLLFAVSILAIRPVLNVLPFNYENIFSDPFIQILS